MTSKVTRRKKRKSFNWAKLMLSIRYILSSALGCALLCAICALVLFLMAGTGTEAVQNAVSVLKHSAIIGAVVGAVFGFVYALLPPEGQNSMDGFLGAIINGLLQAMTFPI
jgi:ADP-ribosylglycohydrolase